MAVSDKVYNASGSTLFVEHSSAWVEIGNVTSIDGADMSVGTAERKALSITTGKRRVPTIPDYGNYSGSAELAHDDPGFVILKGLIAEPAVVNWKIVWSDDDATEDPFSGILTKLSIKSGDNEGLAQYDWEIATDGPPTP